MDGGGASARTTRVKKSEYLRRLEEEGVETGVEIDVEEEEDREKRKEEENGCVTVAADDVENNGTDIDQLVEAAKNSNTTQRTGRIFESTFSSEDGTSDGWNL